MSNAIHGLSNTKVPPELSLWVFNNFRAIDAYCTYNGNEQKKIAEEYLTKSPDGSYGKILEDGTFSMNYKDKESKEKYQDEIEKLGEQEVEIVPDILDYNKFVKDNPTFMLEPKYLLALNKFIK
jgi:hypothetical protein